MGASLVSPLTGHLDAALTEFAKAFRNNALVSDIVFPRVSVGRQTDKYWVFGRESQELLEQDLRHGGAPAQRIRMSLSTDSYKAESHALASEIPDEDLQNYEAGDLRQDATQVLIDKILLHKEKRFADLITTTNVTNNITLTGTSQWNDFSGSDPIGDIETGKTSIRKNAGVEPNLLVIGEPVYTKLIAHPNIVERFKFTMPGAIGAVELASAFAIPQVLVARAVFTNEAGTVDFLFGKKALLCYVTPQATRRDISFGKTFVWANAPGTIGGIGVVPGRVADPTAKGEIVGVDFYYDQKITAVEAGYLIENAVA